MLEWSGVERGASLWVYVCEVSKPKLAMRSRVPIKVFVILRGCVPFYMIRNYLYHIRIRTQAAYRKIARQLPRPNRNKKRMTLFRYETVC